MTEVTKSWRALATATDGAHPRGGRTRHSFLNMNEGQTQTARPTFWHDALQM